MLYPGRKLTGVFQPHLYSRTQDFAEGFAEALSALDEIILLDIYPAREAPIPGVSSSLIFDQIKNPAKQLVSKRELLKVLAEHNLELLMTLGAGDIDTFVEPIADWLKEKK
jgi:UDP-N-acetylmuramate--alanine ligase